MPASKFNYKLFKEFTNKCDLNNTNQQCNDNSSVITEAKIDGMNISLFVFFLPRVSQISADA